MTYENIVLENKDHISTLIFNRPKALNALNSALFDELSTALDYIENDQNTRVLILTGAGEKAFIAGADIPELAGFSPLEAKFFSKKGADIISKLRELSIPVIAAVNGFALGGGCEVALAADFIYASNKAKFGLPEITLGLIPGFGGTQRLPRLVGINMAKELILTGKLLDADQAKEIGLVNTIFQQEELLSETWKTAEFMATKGRVSIRAAKQTIDNGINVDVYSGIKIETDAFSLCFASEDAQEGTKAFLEKRKPQFKGNSHSIK